MLNEEGNLISKFDYYPNQEWDVYLDYYTEKDVKRMMKNIQGTLEELDIVRKEFREGFTFELSLDYKGLCYNINMNHEYLIINIVIMNEEDDADIPIEEIMYDKYYRMSTFVTVEELLAFIKGECITFDKQNKK